MFTYIKKLFNNLFMKEITDFQLQNLTKTRVGGGSKVPSQFMIDCSNLSVGKKYLMSRTEWHTVYGYAKKFVPKSIVCDKRYKRYHPNHILYGKEYRITSYTEGWVIERIK